MSDSQSRFFQLQTQAAHSTSRPQSTPLHHKLSSSSTSSSSTNSSSSSSSASSSYRSSMDAPRKASVEVMRCSRCAKSVETISRSSSDGIRRVSTDDASANGMVRFGHNLYYCERCAKMVGYV